MRFIDALAAAWKRNDSLLCVGLDPVPARLPQALRGEPEPFFAFNKAVIDATADLVCAYKPQFACYAAAAREAELERTVAYIHETHPGLPVILDAKRGDIGSTAAHYAAEAFDRYGADAVTVNPYLGGDALAPFLDRADRGVVVLCRTSNPGARDLQNLESGGRPLYRIVAEKAARDWNGNGNVMLVIGATWPAELAEIRALAGEMPFLVPGVGAQGGDVAAAVAAGKTAGGAGLVVNASRSIIYAGDGRDVAGAARRAAAALRDTINRARKTP